MTMVQEIFTYEKAYFSLWELAQRYHAFTEFRVIGESHDMRMIPMLEIGKGDMAVFCLGGVYGTDLFTPDFLVKMAVEYCQAAECGWKMDDFYPVRELLERTRLCIIPLLNPDGFEICRKGYRSVRNPIYRQMLKMQRIPREEFGANARGVDIGKNFPTTFCMRKRVSMEPGSENETKALMRIFQEYPSRGLLSFAAKEEALVYYCKSQNFTTNQRSSRMARHLQKCAGKRPSGTFYGQAGDTREDGIGSPQQYYAEKIKQPSLEIQIPCQKESREGETIGHGYEKIRMLPLEYIYSLDA